MARHALVQHLAALAQLNREGYSKALRRPKPAVVANAVAGAAGIANKAINGAKLSQGGGVAGAGVVRKIERQFASVRGIAVVFDGE